MIRAAERVGDLAPVFDGIAADIGARVDVHRALIGRVTYPFMLLVASAILTPLPMVVTGSAGAYVGTVVLNLLTIFALGPGLALGVRALTRVPAVGGRLRRLAWSWPLGTGSYRDRVRARFARVLGRNLESGLAIYESIRTAAEVTADPITIERASRAAEQVREGGGFAKALGSAGLFSEADRMQLVSAERSGTLDQTFKALALQYEERGQRSLQRLVSVFAAALSFAVAIYVAVTVVSGFKEAVLGPMELLEQEIPHLGR